MAENPLTLPTWDCYGSPHNSKDFPTPPSEDGGSLCFEKHGRQVTFHSRLTL